MQKDFLQKGGKQLNALFIQPTTFCNHNCKGCYVKQVKLKGKQLNWVHFRDLFTTFYRHPNYWANQITISVDGLSKETDQSWQQLLIISSILEELNKDTRSKKDVPEVHLTVHSPADLHTYIKNGCSIGWHKLTMISFSELLPSADMSDMLAYFHSLGVKVNYNILLNRDKQYDIQHSITDVDYVYAIMPKNLKDNIIQAKSTIKTYGFEIEKLRKINSSKIYIDRCYNYSIDKTICPGGISQFTVWPDGSVSACPYTNTEATQPAKNTQEVLQNIHKLQLYICNKSLKGVDCIYQHI